MILERKEIKKENGDMIIEGYYDSSNIIKTTYLPSQNHMFIFFQNKLVYSYTDINEELYRNFENAESQGKFFIAEIKKKPLIYRYLREYKLYEFEKQDIINIILESKNGKPDQTQNIL